MPMKKSKLFAGLFIFLIVVAASESYAAINENNLCLPDEQVIFLCKSQYKNIGICASKNLTNQTGFAEYRVYNIDKKTIEFVFPENPIPHARNFILSSQPLPGGLDVQIEFLNNGYLYIIHERNSPIDGEGFESLSEVIVKRDERFLSSIKCTNDDSQIKRAAYESFFARD